MKNVPRLSSDIPRFRAEIHLQFAAICSSCCVRPDRKYIPDNSALPLQVSTADPVADFKQVLEGGQVAQAVQGMMGCILRLLATSMGR